MQTHVLIWDFLKREEPRKRHVLSVPVVLNAARNFSSFVTEMHYGFLTALVSRFSAVSKAGLNGKAHSNPLVILTSSNPSKT